MSEPKIDFANSAAFASLGSVVSWFDIVYHLAEGIGINSVQSICSFKQDILMYKFIRFRLSHYSS